MDFFRAWREAIEPAGYAVVETRPDVDHHVAIVHGEIGLVGAVHSKHAEPLAVRCREGAEPHERRSDGKPRELHEFAQQLRRLDARIDHSPAGIEQPPLGAGDHCDRFADADFVALYPWAIGPMLDIERTDVTSFGELHVLGYVYDHRSRPAACRDVKRLVHDTGEIVDVLDQIVVLGARPGDADRVAFLERVAADQMGRNLPGYAYEGDRIHQGIGEARHRVGGARSRSNQQYAAFAGRAGIAFCGMGSTLLMTDEVVPYFLLLEHFIVNRQHRSAGIAEHMFDALIGQRLEHDACAAQLLRHDH